MNLNNLEIPHGHGLSFKKGISDAVLDVNKLQDTLPNGHNLSYEKGIKLGKELKDIINKKIKK